MKKILNFKFIYFLYLSLVGLIFVFLVPPFQKPDEEVHFYRAVALSTGQFFCTTEQTQSFFYIPDKYFTLAKNLYSTKVHFNYNEKFLYKTIFENINDKDIVDNTSKFEGYCNLPFFAYIPFVIPILLGNLFKSSLFSFFMCRLVLMTIFIFSIFWSWNKLKGTKFRWVIVFYSLIPTVVHQVTAVGYDYVQLFVSPMIFSLIISLNKSKKEKYDFIFFCLLMFVMLVAKPGYYFFSLIYFLIPKNVIAKNTKFYLIKTFIYFLLCFGPGLLFARLYTDSFEKLTLFNPILQLNYIKDPSFTYNLFINTFDKYSDFYFKSFFGLLGWLDYGLPYYFYLLPLVSIGILARHICNDDLFKNSFKSFTVLLLSVVFSILFIFITVYLSWNSIGNREIVGIQGRYFVMFTPFLILLISSLYRMLYDKKIIRNIFFVLFFLFLLKDLVFSIYERYYDYSNILSEATYDLSLIKKEYKNNFITVNSPKRFFVQLEPGRKIGSFGFYQSVSGLPMQMGYKYRLMDSSCDKTLHSGFLDTAKLQKEGVYEEKTGIIDPKGDSLCLELSPLISNDDKYNYLQLFSNENQNIFLRYIQN